MFRPRVFEDERKGHPPNEIIGDAVQREGPWQLLGPQRLDHAEWAKDLSEKPHEDDRPMSHRIKGGDGVTDAVHAHDHSDALPELRVVWLRHVQPLKDCPGKEHCKAAPEQVVEPGGEQDIAHPARR